MSDEKTRGEGGGLRIVMRSVAELSEDPANARSHDERNIASIMASLRAFKQQKPIVVDKSGVVRAGNGTLQAAMALGWSEIATVETDLTGSDAIAYAIADNRTAELASWDESVLGMQLDGLAQEAEELVEAAGFQADELAELLKQFEVDEVLPPELDAGDKEPYQQMAFSLHDSQAELVVEAMAAAREQGGHESDCNDNKNANLLAFICEAFLNG